MHSHTHSCTFTHTHVHSCTLMYITPLHFSQKPRHAHWTQSILMHTHAHSCTFTHTHAHAHSCTCILICARTRTCACACTCPTSEITARSLREPPPPWTHRVDEAEGRRGEQHAEQGDNRRDAQHGLAEVRRRRGRRRRRRRSFRRRRRRRERPGVARGSDGSAAS